MAMRADRLALASSALLAKLIGVAPKPPDLRDVDGADGRCHASLASRNKDRTVLVSNALGICPARLCSEVLEQPINLACFLLYSAFRPICTTTPRQGHARLLHRI